MSIFLNRILEIMSEDVLTENQKFGGVTGFGQNKTDLKSRFLDEDAERKREERAKEKAKSQRSKDEKKEEIQVDPRKYLVSSPLRFTLKQAFVANLINYLDTDDKKHLKEALVLVKEYPKLKEWVKSESLKHLPKNPFSVYSLSEWINETVGSRYDRPSTPFKIWNLTEASLEHKKSNFSDSMVLECQISPDKILLYIPAFTKLMEELIFSGKINEPSCNPLLKAKQHQECITDSDVNSGLITKIHKG
jgi:hypothetical protein